MASFQVSEKTAKILKNFSGISNSVSLQAGKSQRTIAKGKSVLAEAELPDAWPQDTAIYDLNSFLGTLSVFKNPSLTFEEDRFVIRSNDSRIGYRFSDPTTIQAPPTKKLNHDNPEAKFTLSEASLDQLIKVCSLLSLDTVSITVDGRRITVGAATAKNPASNEFSLDIPEADIVSPSSTSEYQKSMTFSTEHLVMLLSGSYEVSIGDWPYGYFKHKTEPVAYYVVAQA